MLMLFFENHMVEFRKLFSECNYSLNIAMAWMSIGLYYNDLRSLANKGVKIEILCDDNRSNSQQQRQMDRLRECGVSIRLVSMPGQHFMHNKFMIIDENIVVTGSANLSRNAEGSMENFVVIRDDLNLVSKYMDQFEKISLLQLGQIQGLLDVPHSNCCGDSYAINLYVLSNHYDDYEFCGDIITICSGCGEKIKSLAEAVSETGLKSAHMAWEAVDGECEFSEYSVNRSIQSYYNNSYISNGVVLHGVGMVTCSFDKYSGEEWYTQIIWKNKFMEGYVADRYYSTFEVNY